jgi:hypothetical protein
VQLAGHDHLKRLGVALVPTSAPDHFTEDTPTAILVRCAIADPHTCRCLPACDHAQFDKATLVAKLKADAAARRRHLALVQFVRQCHTSNSRHQPRCASMCCTDAAE